MSLSRNFFADAEKNTYNNDNEALRNFPVYVLFI